MGQYLILAVQVRNERNPFRPFTFIDLGHVDIILWAPPQSPESFGFYPKSFRRVFISAWAPQRARLLRFKRFTRVPAYWQSWELSSERFNSLRCYLEDIDAGCIDGTVRYDSVKFNCLHLAHRCLQIAGTEPPTIPIKHVYLARTIVPRAFIAAVMPDARYSIMDHDLCHPDNITS